MRHPLHSSPHQEPKPRRHHGPLALGLVLLVGLPSVAQAGRGTRPEPPPAPKDAEAAPGRGSQGMEASGTHATRPYTPEAKVDPGPRANRGTDSTSSGRPIHTPPEVRQKIQDKHVRGGAKSEGNSVFYKKENLDSLTRRAEKHAVFKQRTEAGNYERIVNAGRPVGIDRSTGKRTSLYTVVTDSNNQLVTMFPGVPRFRAGGLKRTFTQANPSPSP